MSEPIQAISQGNYILATQQEVSHDNTLSGNGTVDSPLGLSNETVLYNHVWNDSGGDVNLSETAYNFKLLRIDYMIEGSSELFPVFETKVVDIEAMLANTNNRAITLNSLFSRVVDSVNYLIIRMIRAIINGTTITLEQGINATIANSISGNLSALNKSYCRILRVVGINRIANN